MTADIFRDTAIGIVQVLVLRCFARKFQHILLVLVNHSPLRTIGPCITLVAGREIRKVNQICSLSFRVKILFTQIKLPFCSQNNISCKCEKIKPKLSYMASASTFLGINEFVPSKRTPRGLIAPSMFCVIMRKHRNYFPKKVKTNFSKSAFRF